jgi:GNAT superfamily N-acetyltransferase
MSASSFSHRIADRADLSALCLIMDLATEQLQRDFLSEEQVEASKAIMGLDSQLIEDGTYFLVTEGGTAVGCGGWSRRATLYGGDHSGSLRNERLLDPATEPARVRAMYTHPDHVRRGIGRLILNLCEKAAGEEGFRSVELMSTLAGEPLYRACGYQPVARTASNLIDGVFVPLVHMCKPIR